VRPAMALSTLNIPWADSKTGVYNRAADSAWLACTRWRHCSGTLSSTLSSTLDTEMQILSTDQR